MAEEIWKDAYGYEEYFLVSSFGLIFSKRTNKILRQTTSGKGYLVINTRLKGRGGSSVSIRVHRLVALTFLQNPNGFECVNHLDGNKQNNALQNLEWYDHSRNLKHAYDTGLRSKEKNTTLSLEQQKVAFKMKGRLGCSNRAIAKHIGVSPGVIHRLMRTNAVIV